jgi:hypothetical protein
VICLRSAAKTLIKQVVPGNGEGQASCPVVKGEQGETVEELSEMAAGGRAESAVQIETADRWKILKRVYSLE